MSTPTLHHPSLPVDQEIDLPGGVKVAMVLIPPGEFLMGSTDQEQARLLEEAKAANDQFAADRIPNEGPQHRVRSRSRILSRNSSPDDTRSSWLWGSTNSPRS